MFFKRILPIFLIFFIFILIGCAGVKNAAADSIATSLSGADKNGSLPNKTSSDQFMTVLSGEADPLLMAGFFPTAIKMYEILYVQNPRHQGLAAMLGSLYVMYANAFVQHPAEMLPLEEFEKQRSELLRAKMHYLRGRNYALSALDLRYPDFKKAVFSGDAEAARAAVSSAEKKDVTALYWAGAGWLGAFSTDPLDPVILPSIRCAVVLLEKAAELEPGFNSGGIWEVLSAFYNAAPADFGGDKERAVFAHDQSMKYSGGKIPGPYVTYAQSFCIPSQNIEEFDKALEKALSISTDDNESSRLSSVISQEKARYLQKHRDDFFIIW